MAFTGAIGAFRAPAAVVANSGTSTGTGAPSGNTVVPPAGGTTAVLPPPMPGADILLQAQTRATGMVPPTMGGTGTPTVPTPPAMTLNASGFNQSSLTGGNNPLLTQNPISREAIQAQAQTRATGMVSPTMGGGTGAPTVPAPPTATLNAPGFTNRSINASASLPSQTVDPATRTFVVTGGPSVGNAPAVRQT